MNKSVITEVGTIRFFLLIITILFLTDLAIVLNIPYLRQIFGFLFLAILPGLLILQILKLDKLDFLEKFIMSWGLSISFLMIFGLLFNSLSCTIGYETPLSPFALLISFNIAFIVLAIAGYTLNKDIALSFPKFELEKSEKVFLVIPILFPALCIFGMHIMNTTGNNIILMVLLFLIPIYVAFVCFFNQKIPSRVYPVVIFLISISLVLLLSLRSNHIMGNDTHLEYYFFQTTLNNLYWNIAGYSVLDACLSISLLPTIYQSILNISSEFLYKILYSLIFSISPLVIYVISKKYVGELYGFLTSCFFMSDVIFLYTAFNARTNIAILFVALAMMALFNDKIDPLKKRFLFIVFIASCIVSHYSTTYIFFFIMLGAFVGIEILSKKYTFKKVISLTIVILFFSMLFFWYSQVTETAFNTGIGFIENALSNLNKFFVEEMRGSVEALAGKGISQSIIAYKIHWVFTWLSLIFIAIGVITLIRRRKEMSFPERNFKKPEFLKEKFDVGYFVITLTCSGLLVMTVVLPYIAKGYSTGRLYFALSPIMSIFFVIGGIVIAKYLSFKTFLQAKTFTKNLLRRKPGLKRKNNCFFGKAIFSKEGFDGKNASEVPVYLIILLVLIPYFLCATGVTYNMVGDPDSITLNSEGGHYNRWYVHDQECYSARWLRDNGELRNTKIYTAGSIGDRLVSQAGIRRFDGYSLFEEDKKIEGYIYLGYRDVVDGKIYEQDMRGCQDKFVGKGKIYDNAGSEIWK